MEGLQLRPLRHIHQDIKPPQGTVKCQDHLLFFTLYQLAIRPSFSILKVPEAIEINIGGLTELVAIRGCH
jgi:hypothetical protein